MRYLYLKTHRGTGLRYLGTTVQNPMTYLGSGVHWSRHLKKHGRDVETKILFCSNELDEVKEQGIYYSEKWDIVRSKEFANQTIEQGQGGDCGYRQPKGKYRRTPEQIENLRKGAQNRPPTTDETRRKISEGAKLRTDFNWFTHVETGKWIRREGRDAPPGYVRGRKGMKRDEMGRYA